MKLYDSLISGNSYKVRLLLAHLRRDYERVNVDILAGAARGPDFRAKNPAGQVPLLELDDGRFLPESGAILWYLADGTPYLPQDAFARAEVLGWIFFEQNQLEPSIAVARFIRRFAPADPRAAALDPYLKTGRRVLAIMEKHLSAREFFCGDALSIADIALYGYTHVAGEAGVPTGEFAAVERWLARVTAHPRHVAMSDG